MFFSSVEELGRAADPIIEAGSVDAPLTVRMRVRSWDNVLGDRTSLVAAGYQVQAGEAQFDEVV